MAITTISDHAEQALARLIEQYKKADRLRGVISCLTEQTQIDEGVFMDLLEDRALSTAIGAQLDLMGDIVGLVRPSGMEDENYRALLYAKVGLNNSHGFIEEIIQVFKLVTSAESAHLQELFPAGIMLMSSNQVADEIVNLVWEFTQLVVNAGVRTDHFGYWDTADNGPFSFLGGPGDGDGFGDATDALIGGGLGALYMPTVPEFVFDGNGYSLLESGFGDLTDPFAGGQL